MTILNFVAIVIGCIVFHAEANCSKDSGAATTSGSDGSGDDVVQESNEQDVQEREDDVLPNSALEAVFAAGKATAQLLQGGGSRAVVEVFYGTLYDPQSGSVFESDGDQMRVWNMARALTEAILNSSSGSLAESTVLVFPDSGVAALARNIWPETSFSITSLDDFREGRDVEVEAGTLLVLACPDPPVLDRVCRAAEVVDACGGAGIVLFNPRLSSGDVGIGLAARRLRTQFVSTFETTYSLRPLGDELCVFRVFPSEWKVFVADSETPGRWLLKAQLAKKPSLDEVEDIFFESATANASAGGGPGAGRSDKDGDDDNNAGGGKSENPLASAQKAMRSLSRFMKALQQ